MEDSFVILGTSPTPSMESFTNNKHDEKAKIATESSEPLLENFITNDLISSVASTNSDGVFSLLTHSTIKNQINENDNQKTNNDEKENRSLNSIKSEIQSVSTNINTAVEVSAEAAAVNVANNTTAAANKTGAISKSNSSLPFTSLKNSISQSSNNIENNKFNYRASDSRNNSLAASFLLGHVSMDEIKESVFTQFPSFNSGAKTDDILKLQNFIMEYNELKENLTKTNAEMRFYIAGIVNWKNEMKEHKEQQLKEMEKLRTLIGKLRNENMELRKELEEKIELLNLKDESTKKENEELRKILSEKTSMISNLSVQIEKLDQRQHSSFEYIKKDEDDDKDSKFEHDYIPIMEHKRILKEMERQLSETIAENLQLKDMQKTYIAEIDCLKVNLVSAEELLKKAQNDIILLKSKDLEKTELFENYEKDKNEMKEEMNLLRMQLEIYHKDFQMERDSRQKLSGEKDQLLLDLKMLQKRNQQLIEETQTRFDKEVNKSAPSSSSSIKSNQKKKEEHVITITEYTCPLCMKKFSDVNVLMEHTQDCIDQV